jgi:uncharacterized membrane protein YedE/YeeE
MNDFTPLSALTGGVLIGLASVWLLAANARIAGISGILHGLFAQPPGDRGWRLAFLAGLLIAGFLWLLVFPRGNSSETSLLGMALAGLLVGFGTRLGGGCTSGHGVCGLGRLSLRSLVAAIVFIAAGMLSVYVVRHVL